jgi:hypothetical protein
MTYIPATRRNAPVSSTSTSTPILCVTALLLIYSKLAPTSARPSHGMMSREESGRLGDHVWLTGKALDKIWRPRRDLNPCYRRERATP